MVLAFAALCATASPPPRGSGSTAIAATAGARRAAAMPRLQCSMRRMWQSTASAPSTRAKEAADVRSRVASARAVARVSSFGRKSFRGDFSYWPARWTLHRPSSRAHTSTRAMHLHGITWTRHFPRFPTPRRRGPDRRRCLLLVDCRRFPLQSQLAGPAACRDCSWCPARAVAWSRTTGAASIPNRDPAGADHCTVT